MGALPLQAKTSAFNIQLQDKPVWQAADRRAADRLLWGSKTCCIKAPQICAATVRYGGKHDVHCKCQQCTLANTIIGSKPATGAIDG